MCEPTTILFATSMALTAYSGYQQAQAQRQQGNALNNYYDALQQTSQLEAQYALKTGQTQSKLIQDQAKREGKTLAKSQAQFNASQRAKMASMGMDLSSVTAEDITFSNLSEQELDELTLRHNADLKSWQVETDANYKNWALLAQADQYGYAGDQAKYAGRVSARNTLLGTATSMVAGTLTSGFLSSVKGTTQGVVGYAKGYRGAPKNTVDMGTYTAFKPLS